CVNNDSLLVVGQVVAKLSLLASAGECHCDVRQRRWPAPRRTLRAGGAASVDPSAVPRPVAGLPGGHGRLQAMQSSSPMAREAAHGERRFMLEDVPWWAYVALRDALEDSGTQMTYLEGSLELMSPRLPSR